LSSKEGKNGALIFTINDKFYRDETTNGRFFVPDQRLENSLYLLQVISSWSIAEVAFRHKATMLLKASFQWIGISGKYALVLVNFHPIYQPVKHRSWEKVHMPSEMVHDEYIFSLTWYLKRSNGRISGKIGLKKDFRFLRKFKKLSGKKRLSESCHGGGE
jgi:hypothetical protein